MTFDCLVVDDEKPLLDSTSEYLNLFGVKTITAETAKECMDILNKYTIRLILLDINLNKDSGFELCKKIREISNIPIIFISARNSDDDMILALHIGGDDYLQKPYSLSYLLAKIKAVLKRYYPETVEEVISLGICTVNLKNETVYKENIELKLKSMERKLLFYFLKNRGRTISKEELFQNVWDDTLTGDNTLNVHMHYLRDKFEEDPNNPKLFKTVWGVGYLLREKG